MIVLAVTIMQLVVRFMRVATSELLGDRESDLQERSHWNDGSEHLGIILVLTGWWQYLWICLGGQTS